MQDDYGSGASLKMFAILRVVNNHGADEQLSVTGQWQQGHVVRDYATTETTMKNQYRQTKTLPLNNGNCCSRPDLPAGGCRQGAFCRSCRCGPAFSWKAIAQVENWLDRVNECNRDVTTVEGTYGLFACLSRRRSSCVGSRVPSEMCFSISTRRSIASDNIFVSVPCRRPKYLLAGSRESWNMFSPYCRENSRNVLVRSCPRSLTITDSASVNRW